MSLYDYGGYGTYMEPHVSTWTATGVLYLDGAQTLGKTVMTHQSESQYVSGTVSKWVDWTGKCRNGHAINVRAVEDGESFRSSSILKQCAPCDGACGDPEHRMDRYVCAACLAAGSTVEVSPRIGSRDYSRSFQVSGSTTFETQVDAIPSAVKDIPYVFVLNEKLNGVPEGSAFWMEGTVRLSEAASMLRSSQSVTVTWVSHDELKVLSRVGEAPMRPLAMEDQP